MGLTYQELKRTKKNSIVLEKRENIEIQQNSEGFSKTKRTFVRERFYNKPPERFTFDNDREKRSEQEFSKETVDIATAPKHSVVLEDQQGKFEQRIQDTSYRLANLEGNMKHEIEKLKGKIHLFLNAQKLETKRKGREKHQSKGREETWADRLACSSYNAARKQDHLEIAKERFSLQHQCICTSPRYADDKDLIPRPCQRSVGSQMTEVLKHLDQGAVDYNSFEKLKLKNENKFRYSKAEVLPILTNNDQTVNCCYGLMDNSVCSYCVNSKAHHGGICHHHNKHHKMAADSQREYNYCCGEYYCDCKNCTRKSQYAQYCKAAVATCHNRRQRTDLNTQHFYCRPFDRSCSPKSHCDKKTKTENKKTFSKDKESYAEKKFKDQTNKRQSSKSKEVNGKRTTEAEKLYKLLGDYKASKILKLFDRYIDDHENDMKLQHSDTYSTATSAKQGTETKSCQVVTLSKKRQPSATTNTELRATCDNVALEAQYSLRTLIMLSTMKIREYKPLKPKDKFEENKQKSYQQYVEKYAQENKAKEAIEVLKDPSKTLRHRVSDESDIFIQQAQRSSKEQYRTEAFRESASKGRDFRASGDKINISHEQKSLQTIATSATRDLTHFNYAEVPQSCDESIYKYKQPKTSVESWDEHREFTKQFEHTNFAESYRGPQENEKAYLQYQKHWAKYHNGYEEESASRSKDYNDPYKESNVKEEKAVEPGNKYDANKIKISDTLKQEMPHVSADLEKIVNEGKFVNETCKESAEIIVQSYTPHARETNENNQKNKASIDNKSEIHRDGIEHGQCPSESLTERSSGAAKNQQDHGSRRESKYETERTPGCGIESDQDYDSIDNKKTKSTPYKDCKVTDPQLRETFDKKKQQPLSLELVWQLEKETLNSPESHSRQKHAETLKQKQIDAAAIPQDTEADYATKQAAAIKPKFSDFDHLKQETENFLPEKPQEYLSKEFDEMKQNSQSSTYNDFKQLMDHNLGVFAHKSSETANNFKTELTGQISKQTFTAEIDHEQISQSHSTIDEALTYLESFFKSFKMPGVEEKCLNSVTTAANDLITKLSSCKSLATNQPLTSQEDFKESRKSSEDEPINIFEQTTKRDVEYKDLESTPASSDLQVKQQTKEKENFSVSDESSENKPEVEKKKDFLIVREELDSSQVAKDIEPTNIAKQLKTNEFVEQESYQLRTQTDSQHWLTLETYKRYQECKENQNSLTSLTEFANGEATHDDLNYKPEYCCAPCAETQYTYRDLSSSSRQPVFDPDLMPLKGILKPCRIVPTPNDSFCDLETYRTTSVVSFEQKGRINIPEGPSMIYNQEQETRAQHVNANMKTIVTEDRRHSLSKQSNLKLNETNTIQQPIFQDCLSRTESVLAQKRRKNYSPASHTVKIPAFKQCPCMWETYVKMVKNFYKEQQKQRQMLFEY